MEVIILAGGLGTRLRSVVAEVPKCMAPINGKPFLWYLLNYISKYNNISKVILSVGYLREVIYEWIDKVKDDYPFFIEYAIEEEPLGTGGGIRLAMEKVTDSEAVILNGDTFFDVDLEEFYSFYRSHKDSDLVIALKPMTNFDRYGAVEMNESFKILNFKEKKRCASGLINGGVYILANKKSIFKNLPNRFSFEKSIMEPLSGEEGSIYGCIQNGYFIDIGIPEDYIKAQTALIKLK